MLSKQYHYFINNHKFLTNKVSVCDLAFQLKNQRLNMSELREVALYVYKKTPKYAYIVFQKLISEIFPSKTYERQEDRQIQQDVHYGLVALFIAKQSTFPHEDFQVFKSRALKAYMAIFDRNFNLNPKNILLRAYFSFYQGELTQALQIVRNLSQVLHVKQHFMKWSCHLLIAQICFARRQYQKCIDELKICFKLHNDLPLQARVAMAHCYFHLGRYEMAEAIFKRILQLDSRCIEAVIGLAVICQRNEQYQNYFYCLKIAKKNHPLILLHLAEHCLIIKQLDKAREFAQRGLKAIKRMTRIHQYRQPIRDDYFEYQGRFWNIIGQIYHIQGRHAKALKWYNQLSRKDISCNLWNRVHTAQCLIALQLYKQANYVMQALYQQYHDYFGKIYKQTKVLGDTWRMMAYLKVKLKQYKSEAKKTQYYFLQSIKFDRSNPLVRFQVSWFYSLQMDHKKALNQCKYGMELMSAQEMQSCAEIYNNWGVLHLQNDELESAELMLQQALQKLQNQNELHEADKAAISSVILYNAGIVAQENKLIETAIQLYKQIIDNNRLFIDVHLRLAYCYFLQGAKQLSYQLLAKALQMANKSQLQDGLIHYDRIYLLKAYIEMQAGQLQDSMQSMNQISSEDSYFRLLKMAIQYYTLCKWPQQSKFQQFKSIAYQLQQIIEKDHHNIFAVAALLTLNLTIQQMNVGTPLQEYQVYGAFGQIKSNINKKYLALIDYNAALYSIRIDNMSSAVSLLKELRKNSMSNIYSLSAYCHLSTKQVAAACKLAKINVLLSPADIVVRYQLQLVTFRKCKEKADSLIDKSRDNEFVRQMQELRYCCRFFKYCALIDSEQYCSHNPDINKRVIQKLRSACKTLTEEAIACHMKHKQQLRTTEQNLKRQSSTPDQASHIKKRYKFNLQSG